ncbi:hypothetical protein B0H10DRAFT_2078825 [Mycena sp. CBHHK59/15]|nr:hypothetical protein B0H10DRAFT_2078825 [Mycena sp. CBHHK59/15]
MYAALGRMTRGQRLAKLAAARHDWPRTALRGGGRRSPLLATGASARTESTCFAPCQTSFAG